MSSTHNRRPAFPSSMASSLAKKHEPLGGENVGKSNAALSRKRAPLGNITNQCNVSHVGSRSYAASTALVPYTTKVAKTKKESSAGASNSVVANSSLPAPANVKSSAAYSCEDDTVSRVSTIPSYCNVHISRIKSHGKSVSMDESSSMSICDSFSSPEAEYLDNNGVPAIDSINRKTFSSLCISNRRETAGNMCTRDELVGMETNDITVDIGNSYADPLLGGSDYCDIRKHLRGSEAKKRPSIDYMEKVQKDINAEMRAILINWLVEVAAEFRLVPYTLYLTVNYLDRYLSGNLMNRQRLQLLGVSCMMIAAKYEEIYAPCVEDFCYMTDNGFFKEEILEMESAVLNYLKFELAAPTVRCFLRQFDQAIRGIHEDASTQLECMINFIAELSLLEYSMLRYAPSLIAASAIFLAKYILFQSKRPWDSLLRHYTLYKSSDLRDCVKDLHRLCSNIHKSNFPAIREKYSQHKYECVAREFCPPTIPSDYFDN